MAKLLRIAFSLLLLSAVSTVHSQDAFTAQCEDLPRQPSAQYFADFARQVFNAKRLFCKKTPLEVPDYPASFLDSPDHLRKIGAEAADLTQIKADLAEYVRKKEVPQMQASSRGRIEMNMAPYQVISDISVCDAMAAALVDSGTCAGALQEFVEIYNDGQAFYGLYKAVKTVAQLETLEGKWDMFLEYSKSQTLWELAFNGWIYKNSEEASFKRPPSGQWVLLHPGVVIENVSEAVDGSETKEALILDVFGYNDWTREAWYIPSGITYSVIYSDRQNVEDWGNAISLYFKSKYILGYSDHDGDQGWYVSVDLLDFFRDKKQQFATYTSQF